jgi:hypothetical protein
LKPRLLLGWALIVAALVSVADRTTAQVPPQAPKPLKPGEECSVPDDPATVSLRELQKRTETYVGLSAMTVGNALHDVDRYWREREQALVERLSASTPPVPAADASRNAPADGQELMDLYYLERLEGISEACKILSGSDPAACRAYWSGPAADICRGWLAVRGLPKGDPTACAAVAEEFRPFCLFQANGPKTACVKPEGVVAEACDTLTQARARDWSAGCSALQPNECIGLLSALSMFEGDAACDRLPARAPVNLALRRAPPAPNRDACLAVVRGEPALCPAASYPNTHAKPSLVAEVLSGRDGAHLAIAGSSYSPSICRVVAVITQAGAVLSVETELVRTDNARQIRARRPLRSQIDPFEAQVHVESVCAPVLSWGASEVTYPAEGH